MAEVLVRQFFPYLEILDECDGIDCCCECGIGKQYCRPVTRSAGRQASTGVLAQPEFSLRNIRVR